jgi:carboxyl-terminal processing protease
MLKTNRSRFLVVSVAVVTICLAGLVLARSANVRDSMMLFNDVMTKVRDEYVDRVDLEKLIDGAINGMMDTLDPHSQFLTQKQYDDLMISTHGSFGGLGIEIDIRNDWLTVIAPIENTPAYRIGIRGGDKIVKIEDKSTRGITLTDAVKKLRGPEGTEVTITIQREGEPELLDYTITRAVIKIASVPFSTMVNDDLGYVRVAQFSEDTSKELGKALNDLEAQGMGKLIVDLRRNTGGLLTQAIEVSEEFLKPGQTVVSTRGRKASQTRTYEARARAAGGDYPLVVLVDNQSASASEIVAGAVQDLDRGLIVGLPTFGKGTVQSVIALPGGSALKLTTAKYFTPSGRCIDKAEWMNEDSAVILSDETESDSGRVYYTLSGRSVTGGGGIHPDIEIEADDVPRIASMLAREGLVFEYAVTYVATHPDISADFDADPAFFDKFEEFLAQKQFEYTKEDMDEGRDFVEVMLRAEIARKVWGDEAAYRISMERDSQLQKTVDLINGTKTLADLFTLAAEYSEAKK